jgi:NitT/TauT family transport system substrate-binding protein
MLKARRRIDLVYAFALLGICATLVGASSAGAGRSAAPMTNVSVQLIWFPQAEFAGYYVAQAEGFYKAAGLNVKIIPGGPNLTPTSVVASGGATFGGGLAPFDVLTAAGQGIKLEQVAIDTQLDSIRLVSNKKLGITQPKQLEGKTVGVWTGTWEEEAKIMVANDGGDPNKVHWVTQGASLAPIINGSWAAGSATTYNEMNLLKEQNVPINVLDPAKYNTAFPRGGIATTEVYAQQHPQIVQAFLAATFKGWRWAFLHKQQAVAITMKEAPGMTQTHQMLMLENMQSLLCAGPALTHGMGYVDPAQMTRALDFLTKYKVAKAPSSVAGTYSDTFVNAIPAADKSCSGL